MPIMLKAERHLFMTETIKWAALIILLLVDYIVFIPGYNRKKFDHTPRKEKLTYKGISIGIIFLILLSGYINGLVTHKVMPQDFLWVLGMLSCAFGDIILEIKFTKGGLLFGLGHLLYIAALVVYTEKISLLIVILYICFALAGTVLTIKYLGSRHRGLMILYNCVISFSFALGANLSVVKATSTRFVFIGIGMCLLVISDWILARNRRIGTTETRSMMCLTLYFSGQALLAVSMWV